MFLLEEIAIEVVMIGAVLGAAACLGYLLFLTVLERVYLARQRRDRMAACSTLVVRAPSADSRRAPTAWRRQHA